MAQALCRILVTGARGFIGQNLVVRLSEVDGVQLLRFERGDDPVDLPALIGVSDAVVHLAGENRPDDSRAFEEINFGLTRAICNAIRHESEVRGRDVPLILTSSIQAERDNPYGRSKLAAEEEVRTLLEAVGGRAVIFRLPGVFGKWCRPNYNSVVATFCYNVARGLPIRIENPETVLRLVYIDDVVDAIIACLRSDEQGLHFVDIVPEYGISLGELATMIKGFEADREALQTERVGSGLIRALYATYLSHLPKNRFAYDIPRHVDERGVFVEILKTRDSGQFSFLTAPPGVTRGGHYHHTKSEKFLVIKGKALFRFRHLLSDESFEIVTTGEESRIVETVPGWAHNITNVGSDELVVMLWANEVFDREHPDTIASRV
jgi:UDP-2-acetamido-2,6-beta-L-arabino-hexul-4-ose reductase